MHPFDLFDFNDKKLPPFNRKEFHDAFYHAYKAIMFGGTPFPDPAKRGFIMEEEDSLREYRFTDNPLNRAGFAIVRLYKNEPEKSYNFLIRYFALQAIWDHERMSEFKRPAENGLIEFNDVILDAAAVTKLIKGRFDEDEFFSTARKFALETQDSE